MITKNIERAQRRVEEQNFTIRKRVLEYDDVMNKQRQIIYQLRNQILHGEDLWDDLAEMVRFQLTDAVAEYTPEDLPPEDWDYGKIVSWVRARFPIDVTADQLSRASGDREQLTDALMAAVGEAHDRRQQSYGSDLLLQLERFVMLTTLDEQWQDHLTEMDELREGISLRSYGQLDPLVEYKREAYEMFEALLKRIDDETISKVFRVQIGRDAAVPQPVSVRAFQPELEALAARARRPQQVFTNSPEESRQRTIVRSAPKVGRNDPCPCGSGKKYKKCHGAGAESGGDA